jgi:hypothetical protein
MAFSSHDECPDCETTGPSTLLTDALNELGFPILNGYAETDDTVDVLRKGMFAIAVALAEVAREIGQLSAKEFESVDD